MNEEMSDAPAGGLAAGKVVAIGVVLAILAGVGAIGYHHATRNKRRHEAGAEGQKIYALYCARCHQDSGQGQGAFPSLLKNEMDLPAFTKWVKEGKPPLMPAFPDWDPADYEKVHLHVQELKRTQAAGD